MLTRIRLTLTHQIVYKEHTMNHIIIILKIRKNKPCSPMHISYKSTPVHFNNVHRCVLGALNQRFIKKYHTIHFMYRFITMLPPIYAPILICYHFYCVEELLTRFLHFAYRFQKL